MASVILYLFIFPSISLATQTTLHDDYYIGAVVEYHSRWKNESTPRENVLANVENYVDIIKEAGLHMVDIIVFPQNGLTDRDDTQFVEVPDPKDQIVPAVNKSMDEVLQKISGAARKNSLYVVININEKDKSFKYNTNIVFDRIGKLIARYRTYNIFGQTFLNAPPKPEYVYFDTDFGVRFGIFSSFDILYEEPALGLVKNHRVTDIVYPAEWLSELPFLTSLQIQESWSYTNNVNLLAANRNSVEKGFTGSGLYRGENILSSPFAKKADGTVLIVGEMPKKGNDDGNIINSDLIIPWTRPEPKDFFFLKEDLSMYTSELLPIEKSYNSKKKILHENTLLGYDLNYFIQKKVCKQKFCCVFNINMTTKFFKDSYYPHLSSDVNFNQFRYRLVVADGLKNIDVAKRQIGVQICGVVPCINENIETCNQIPKSTDKVVSMTFDDIGHSKLILTDFSKIEINGQFESKKSYITHSILTSAFGSDDIGHTVIPYMGLTGKDNTVNATIIFDSENLIAGGIYNRIFSRDIEEQSNGAATIQISRTIPLVFIILFSFINFKKT